MIMKTSKIFATVAAVVTMFTAGVTDAMAQYHANKVTCTAGCSEKSFELHKLGTSADGCEIWGGFNDTGNKAYFRCNIDGTDFVVPTTDISVNTTHDLVEKTWANSMLVRNATSDSQHMHLVKVKVHDGDGNKYRTVTSAWLANTDYDTWTLTDVKVDITAKTQPVYDAESGTYKQDFEWNVTTAATKYLNKLWNMVAIYAYFDGDYTHPQCVGGTNRFFGLEKTITADIPAGHTSAEFFAVVSGDIVLLHGKYGWVSDFTPAFTFPEAQQAKQAMSDFDLDDDTTNGIGGISSETADSPVNIYNLSGVCVASQTSVKEAAESLKHGVYIVNGKKMVLGK